MPAGFDIVTWFLDILFPSRKLLAEMRANWGRTSSKLGWLVSSYFDLTRTSSSVEFVNDQTWADLEMPTVFSQMDTTITPIGSQVLYRQLRTYIVSKSELDDRHRGYDWLRRNPQQREAIQLKLIPLRRRTSVADIAESVFGGPLSKPRSRHVLRIMSALSFATPAAVLILHLPVLWWVAIVIVNAVTVMFVTPKLHRKVELLENCSHMLLVADKLAALRTTAGLPFLDRLAREASRRVRARRALRWFSLSREQIVIEMICFWLNVMFLVDFVAYLGVVDRFAAIRDDLGSTFEAIGLLDAATANASLLERLPGYCVPEIVDDPTIDLVDAYHPLLKDPVRNSLQLRHRSALVTGSNMAGKTTFIKVVGINILFGRTVGYCFASKAVIPRSSVMASIRSDQSVEQGKSRYFAEIEAILSFLRAARAGECRVFLIDEIFSGTNTVERVAAARAVLERLSAEAQVLATTHDVELQLQLAPRFDLYHFHERLDIEGFFDYRLLPGPATERNAIRLLGRLGFPPEVVRAALVYAESGSVAANDLTISAAGKIE